MTGKAAGALHGRAEGGSLDHDDFGLNPSKIMNVIDSKNLERDAGGKPVPTFPHPAWEENQTPLKAKIRIPAHLLADARELD